jgi:hypothetical protein
MKGLATPTVMDETIIRSQDIIQLFDQSVITDTITHDSDSVVCQAFKRFLIYIKLVGATVTPTLRYEIQFLDDKSRQWNTYAQGLFASLYYHDPTNVVNINECFEGECMGREFRVRITGTATTAVHYFTTSVSVEFRN